MSRIEDYRQRLRGIAEWEPFLLAESGLPGPRGNIELAQAAADEGRPGQFATWLAWDAAAAPTNTPQEFLAFCGILGQGALLARGPRGRSRILAALRRAAADPRWRAREAVAMALQRLGDADIEALMAEMERWSGGSALEQRAAAAAVCEPRLLASPPVTRRVLRMLDRITASLAAAGDERDEARRVLEKGLGYCWSVAAAALPEAGLKAMERWMTSPSPSIRRVMRENLTKARLARIDASWVRAWQARLATPGRQRKRSG